VDWVAVDNSPAAIRALLEAEQISLKKRWGQNFMVAPGSRELIVGALGPSAADVVWEIGPGLGAITSALVESAARVIAFEIDHGIIRIITRRFGSAVTVVAGDAVQTIAEWRPTADIPSPTLVAGNLPYRSAAPIIGALLASPASESAGRMVFTVQLEMARRMTASVGEKDYSPLSVLCRLAGSVRLVAQLRPGSFYPRPEVESAVVALEPSREFGHIRAIASVCARSLFARRRKTIRNNAGVLAGGLSLPVDTVHAALADAGIAESERAERLPPETFARLAGILAVAGRAGPDTTTDQPH
jgi:16S rRNA (adenine1518-N6/adenine1519-N6)-dimethyltransferase